MQVVYEHILRNDRTSRSDLEGKPVKSRRNVRKILITELGGTVNVKTRDVNTSNRYNAGNVMTITKFCD